MGKEIYSRHLSIQETLSTSWQIFKQNFRTILLLTLAVYIPVNLILSIIPLGESLQSLSAYLKIIGILETLIGVLATMAIAYLVKMNLEGKTVTFHEAINKAFSKWGSALIAGIIVSLAVGLLSLLLIIPGILYLVYWSFVIYAIVLSDRDKDAMDYSKSIVEGRWWTVAGRGLLYFILSMLVLLVQWALEFLVSLVIPQNIVLDLASMSLTDITNSFFTVVWTIFFINFEATKKDPAKKSNQTIKKP